MNIRNRLFGECAKLVGPNDEIEVFVNELINRLIFFNKYFLNSIRLKELNSLIDIFGLDGTIELIKSGILEICCYAVITASIGQNVQIRSNRGLKPLPLLSYSFDIMKSPKWNDYLDLVIKDLDNSLNLSSSEKTHLISFLYEFLREPPKELGIESVQQMEQEILANNILVKRAVLEILNERITIYKLQDLDFNIQINKVDERDFKVETDLGKYFGYDKGIIHKIIERAILAIGGLNLRIEEMKFYNALSGFQDRDLPILDKKLEFIAEAICPNKREIDFKRVLEIANFPQADFKSSEIRIDVEKLLKIRESKEIKEFKYWLSDVSSISDHEIYKIVRGIKSKISDLYNCKSSTVLKFLLGSIPGPIGITFSALDNFILSKLLNKPGPYIFINHLYPSIFKKI